MVLYHSNRKITNSLCIHRHIPPHLHKWYEEILFSQSTFSVFIPLAKPNLIYSSSQIRCIGNALISRTHFPALSHMWVHMYMPDGRWQVSTPNQCSCISPHSAAAWPASAQLLKMLKTPDLNQRHIQGFSWNSYDPKPGCVYCVFPLRLNQGFTEVGEHSDMQGVGLGMLPSWYSVCWHLAQDCMAVFVI